MVFLAIVLDRLIPRVFITDPWYHPGLEPEAAAGPWTAVRRSQARAMIE